MKQIPTSWRLLSLPCTASGAPLPLGALANMTGLDPDLAQIESLDDKPQTVVGDEANA
ncbi:hypothetical protein P6U16_25460 (plasmid) [Rhizobium sp. 32-5/1]|uniref:hypothetical protein n=1 Tax=Rhizobium sp. 32-5/1 TaxID=3019602 RepID=UPI00240DBEF1|nr:hypothetical protein [Rhizobium sp. 32-5/1]WEZ86124.1 hypothetical protein P6U16_25460 [Rhizobium sp. 32-5/1]